ncbi:NAD(P)-dependent oxidoreductase [Paraburkholderia sp. DHOC27]|uniref:NAD(P)-dependent oxidoreductase n=1 Tax=Paraburkholderia sp. DHOC27 TaxID=2303330 RepID=UPI000E3B707F|nr:NAD(P)-dependent oxidoreductase [Paraburkholderia sp. DHOC27]RFU45462.1 NAD(P)-dependent oxidoreductase [Paraburkholderia sp. DHOC27]
MAKISVLGMGAMGSRMAINLIKAGHQVTVWNRGPAAAQRVVDAGAHLARTPREASSGADFVVAMVRDNDASRQVWLDEENGALRGMSADAIAIESSTVTAEWIRELEARMAERSISLLEAPVVGSTPQAEAAQLTYFVGGKPDVLARAEPVLKVVGSSLHHVGAIGTAALTKLTANTLLGIQVTALAELIGMLKRSGSDVERVLDAVAKTPVWNVVAGRVSSLMLAGNFAPQFPVDLIEKDFAYTVQTAGSESAAPTISAARNVFRTAVERGFGHDNMTGVVKLFT